MLSGFLPVDDGIPARRRSYGTAEQIRGSVRRVDGSVLSGGAGAGYPHCAPDGIRAQVSSFVLCYLEKVKSGCWFVVKHKQIINKTSRYKFKCIDL